MLSVETQSQVTSSVICEGGVMCVVWSVKETRTSSVKVCKKWSECAACDRQMLI